MKPDNIFQKFNLTGKVAIVTGGPGLLGKEFCRTLAEAGASIVVADINAGVATGVTQPASVQALLEETLTTFGRLDILVNSAALDPKFDSQALAEMAKYG